MTREPNGPEGPTAAAAPLRPGEARVWLELGAGSDPVTALEAALADWKARQEDVQGFGTINWQIAGPGGQVQTWAFTIDPAGHLIGRTLLPPQPHVYHSVGPGGEIVTTTLSS